jgi:hypothetical protein
MYAFPPLSTAIGSAQSLPLPPRNVTASSDFPVTANAFQSALAGATDAFVAQFSALTLPVLSIAKTHTGNFTQGQTGATYSVMVSNTTGAGQTSRVVTVTDLRTRGRLYDLAPTEYISLGLRIHQRLLFLVRLMDSAKPLFVEADPAVVFAEHCAEGAVGSSNESDVI